MSTNPTLYLSNWSSHRTPGMHGPGRKWTIMARPRVWERGMGEVSAFVPPVEWLDDVKAGRLHADNYFAWLRFRWESATALFPPGVLVAHARGDRITVRDGDTLCCACSVAEARAGRCHRTWAAPFLVRAGWRVVLDGVDVAGLDVREVGG